MPPRSQAQREAMHEAEEGHSTLGIPQKVGEEYDEADPGGKLPKKVKKDGISLGLPDSSGPLSDLAPNNFDDPIKKETGLVKRIMRAFKMNEISAVDRPAQAHAKMVLMKRDGGPPDYVYMSAEDIAYLSKRDFDAAQRRSAASHGDALPDGSFPIKNKEDLANARRLVGHAKDPAAARALISRRAKELGVSLDDGDSKKSYRKILTDIFEGHLSEASAENMEKAIEAFGQENNIMDIELSDDLKKMIDVKVEEVKKEVGDKLKETADKLAKAEEELATLKGESGKDGGHDDDDDGDGAKGGEIKGKMKKADLPEDIQKALAKAEANEIILKGLMEEREVAQFAKQAVELGLDEVHGETLRKAFSGDKTGQDDLKRLMKGMSEQIRSGKVFAEFGSSRSGAGATASAEMGAIATAYRESQEKIGKTCSIQQAFTKIYTDPAYADLKKRYDAEDRKDTLKRLQVV
jgi:hypothetical protein